MPTSSSVIRRITLAVTSARNGSQFLIGKNHAVAKSPNSDIRTFRSFPRSDAHPLRAMSARVWPHFFLNEESK